MSRISKDLASTISKRLTIKLELKRDKAAKELREYAAKIYQKRIPESVIIFNNENPSYIKKRAKIQVFNNGFNGESFELSIDLPCKIQHNEYSGVPINDLTKTEAEKLKELDQVVKKLETQRSQLKQSIYNALLQLVTYKRIIEQFPEAAPYLERKDAYAIAIPVEDIRKQLNELK